MKKFLVVLIVLIVIGGGGYFIWNKYFNKITASNYKEPFMWGVTMRPAALGRYNLKIWRDQLEYAQDLGVKHARIVWDFNAVYNGKNDAFKFHDEVIDEMEKAGVSPVIAFDADPGMFVVDDPYYDGYSKGFQIASHYKGKVKFYQLSNEVSSVPLKGGEFSGEKEEHYDTEKYQKTIAWLKGASEGVKKADAKAYRMICGHWLNTAFFDMINRDKIDYDIIGWDWYGDMDMMGEKKLEDGTMLVDRLKKFNKPVIIAEINQKPEGKDGQDGQDEEKQAEFISNMAEWAYNSGVIKGFIVLELIDSRVVTEEKTFIDRLGLVQAEKDVVDKKTGKITTLKITEPRKAFEVYKGIISKYSGK